LVIPPKPFNGKILNLPDYFNIKIRTYKTYKEWAPFVSYDFGDRVTYYGKLYESVYQTVAFNNVSGVYELAASTNKTNSPRNYELVTPWVSNQSYLETSLVKYNRDIYELLSTTQSTITPYSNFTSNLQSNTYIWKNITEWREIDWDSVQTISEFRQGDDLLPFNFTIDSNIDPFITIEVTSDNGYGCVYSDKKNYEIRGLKDLTEPYKPIETIGPFVPIVINTTLPTRPPRRSSFSFLSTEEVMIFP